MIYIKLLCSTSFQSLPAKLQWFLASAHAEVQQSLGANLAELQLSKLFFSRWFCTSALLTVRHPDLLCPSAPLFCIFQTCLNPEFYPQTVRVKALTQSLSCPQAVPLRSVAPALSRPWAVCPRILHCLFYFHGNDVAKCQYVKFVLFLFPKLTGPSSKNLNNRVSNRWDVLFLHCLGMRLFYNFQSFCCYGGKCDDSLVHLSYEAKSGTYLQHQQITKVITFSIVLQLQWMVYLMQLN